MSAPGPFNYYLLGYKAPNCNIHSSINMSLITLRNSGHFAVHYNSIRALSLCFQIHSFCSCILVVCRPKSPGPSFQPVLISAKRTTTRPVKTKDLLSTKKEMLPQTHHCLLTRYQNKLCPIKIHFCNFLLCIIFLVNLNLIYATFTLLLQILSLLVHFKKS